MKPFATLTLGLLTLVGLNAQAQKNLENGDFESWGEHVTKVAADWTVSGAVSQSTDVHEGSSAIRLTNKKATGERGMIATGPFVGNRLGGIPYDEQPLSIRFRCKYDLALGDQAQVAVIFSLKGNTVAYSSTMIEGSSKDTFGYFSVPITWSLSTNPDSVAIALSSLDLQTNTMNGDGYVIFDDFHFATISTRNKAVPNGDFESWVEHKRPDLEHWYTSDDYLYDLSGVELSAPLVQQTAAGRSGTKAIELVSQQVGNDIIPGMIISGNQFNDFDKPAIAVDKQWKYLEGYYQYQPVNGDTAMFGVIMFKNGVPFGYTEQMITQSTSTFTYFALKIDYAAQLTPDSAIVLVASSNPENAHAAGSKLVLDDLRFSDNNSSVFDITKTALNIYPNPCSDYVKLATPSGVRSANWSIVSMTGIEVTSGTVNRETKIDVSGLSSGVYLLRLSGDQINTTKILVKE